jgi:hypothetical protein
MSDYVIPCAKSTVHPDGLCRRKLHKNIGGGLHRLMERHQQEEYEEALNSQYDAINQQRAELDLQEKMLGVGAGTHRVMKETRKNPPRVTPVIPGLDPSKKPKGK